MSRSRWLISIRYFSILLYHQPDISTWPRPDITIGPRQHRRLPFCLRQSSDTIKPVEGYDEWRQLKKDEPKETQESLRLRLENYKLSVPHLPPPQQVFFKIEIERIEKQLAELETPDQLGHKS